MQLIESHTMSNTDSTPDVLENFVRLFENIPDRFRLASIHVILNMPDDDDSPAPPEPAAPQNLFTPDQIERLQRAVNAAVAAVAAVAANPTLLNP